MRMQPRVSVIIPTYNRRESLRRTLQSLTTQDYGHSLFEVLIADTGSTDGTAEMVQGFKSSFPIRRLLVPKRYTLDAPIARNAGAEAATGDILIFIDSDIVVPQHFIREHVFCHDYVNHAFVGGAVCHAFGMGTGAGAESGCLTPDLDAMLAPHQACMLEFSGNLGGCRFPWSYCYGANYSMTREDFVAHALRADEVFAERGLAASDTELSYRAYLAGLRVLFSRFAVAYHDLGTAPTFNSTERTDRVLKGLSFIASKHPSRESSDYFSFRTFDCEAFLDVLLKGARLRTFPTPTQPDWLAWIEKVLGAPTPSTSILLLTAGDADCVEKALITLGQCGCFRNDVEVLVCDSSISGQLGSARGSQCVDLLVQRLKTDFCLRYYPVSDIAPLTGPIGIGLKTRGAHADRLNRALSRIGWHFSAFNRGLYGRVRGRVLTLLDEKEEITPELLSQRLGSSLTIERSMETSSTTREFAGGTP